MTTRFTVGTVLTALALMVTANTTSIATDTAGAYLGVTSPIVSAQASQAINTASTIAYVKKQLIAYNLRKEELLALPVGLQREVLSMDGIQRPLTREERHAIVPFKQIVPADVISTVTQQGKLSVANKKAYAVSIPTSISQLPDGFEMVVLGGKVFILNANNQVIGSSTL
jgi:hypothetical protein